jgi:hypothetical protein
MYTHTHVHMHKQNKMKHLPNGQDGLVTATLVPNMPIMMPTNTLSANNMAMMNHQQVSMVSAVNAMPQGVMNQGMQVVSGQVSGMVQVNSVSSVPISQATQGVPVSATMPQAMS